MECTGVKFRGVQTQYFDKKSMSFNYKETFRLLKRETCKCRDCKEVVRCLEMDGEILIDCSHWFETFNHQPIENGAMYKMEVLSWDSDYDYEAGYNYCFPEEVKMIKVAN